MEHAHDLEVSAVPLTVLQPYHKNPRRGDTKAIADSLRTNGQYRPIVVNLGTRTGRENEILAGNHTYFAAEQLRWSTIQVSTVDVDDVGAARIVAADNRTADLGSYDNLVLAELLAGLPDLEGTGYSDNELKALTEEPVAPNRERLADRFGAPPVTVLSARGGEWNDRKRLWNDLGLRSQEGRAEELVYDSPQTLFSNWYDVKNKLEAAAGTKLVDADVIKRGAADLKQAGNGTSVFDPALAELLVSWFSAPGQRVIDPWAGGSVRGVVSSVLGRDYVGVELRPEQVAANRMQLDVIGAAVRAGVGLGGDVPEWVSGEAAAVLEALPSESFDLAFSAPPRYGVGNSAEGDFMPELTPVEEHGGFLVKREDAWSRGGASGAKSRAMFAAAESSPGLITAGARNSAQIERGALVARALGIPCRIHTGHGSESTEMALCVQAGAEVFQHFRMNTIKARFREDVVEHSGWASFPFGMEHPVYLEQVAAQVVNVPESVRRIVVPFGSGMTLAAVVLGLEAAGRDIPVLAVSVGTKSTSRLDEYAPGWESRVTVLEHPSAYEDPASELLLGELRLDPIYEAKCIPYLEEGDLLWTVGVRSSVNASLLGDVKTPEWIEGESTERLREMDAASFDLAFGCPPYYNLEKYSDDPRDLSNLSTKEFDEQMVRNIGEVARVLKPDSFAVFVVGSVRDKRGHILDMRRCMSAAAEAAGMFLVNDAVLVTPVGNAAMRSARAFVGSRVLTRTHQEVLVYVKGNRKAAAARCGEVDPGGVLKVEVDE
jgi:DNA modification methylase